MKPTNKYAACTKRPWEHLIPKNIRHKELRQVRQECIDIYGHSFDECPKRLVCFSKTCLGRPLEWQSKTAFPYLCNFTKKNTDWVVTGCSNCETKDSCKSMCQEVYDYTNRFMVEEINLTYKENMDNYYNNPETEQDKTYPLPQVPWDILSKQKRIIVKQYLYKHNDFKYIADKFSGGNQAYIKYQFYSALTKLSEYGIMRVFLTENRERLTEKQIQLLELIYEQNKSISKAARELNISKQAAQQILKRIKVKYRLKWKVFVRKKNNKVIYSIPKVLK